jgi:hypothetical protein
MSSQPLTNAAGAGITCAPIPGGRADLIGFSDTWWLIWCPSLQRPSSRDTADPGLGSKVACCDGDCGDRADLVVIGSSRRDLIGRVFVDNDTQPLSNHPVVKANV